MEKETTNGDSANQDKAQIAFDDSIISAFIDAKDFFIELIKEKYPDVKVTFADDIVKVFSIDKDKIGRSFNGILITRENGSYISLNTEVYIKGGEIKNDNECFDKTVSI
jgi:hypothetical protein